MIVWSIVVCSLFLLYCTYGSCDEPISITGVHVHTCKSLVAAYIEPYAYTLTLGDDMPSVCHLSGCVIYLP